MQLLIDKCLKLLAHSFCSSILYYKNNTFVWIIQPSCFYDSFFFKDTSFLCSNAACVQQFACRCCFHTALLLFQLLNICLRVIQQNVKKLSQPFFLFFQSETPHFVSECQHLCEVMRVTDCVNSECSAKVVMDMEKGNFLWQSTVD